MEIPGIVLAGGKSNRMKKDKATLLWNGKPWIECVINALVNAGCNPIIVSINSQDDIKRLKMHLNYNDVTWIIDDCEIEGMKGGLITSLRYASEMGWDVVQLAPCDTPRVKPELFKMYNQIWSEKFDIIVPNLKNNENSEGFEPLLARVRVEKYLSELTNPEYENSRILDSYSKLNVYLVTENDFENFNIDQGCVSNYNTPEEII